MTARAPSPCVGVCRLDDATGYCLGCARTGDEIARWRGAAEADRRAVWDELPARFARLGVACRRLPWDAGDNRAFVAETVTLGSGTWTLGVLGAVGEFPGRPGAPARVAVADDLLTARIPGAILGLRLGDKVRAFAFDPGGAGGSTPDRVALTVWDDPLRPPPATGLSALGPDRDALDPGAAGAPLFDLGLGRREARFAVRAGDDALARLLEAHLGTPAAELLAALGPALVAASPTRVIETALGRMEVASPIPPPGGTSPDGPHTHLLPDHLARGRALPDGMDLPAGYVAGAVFYRRR